jgi:hypothetical protein
MNIEIDIYNINLGLDERVVPSSSISTMFNPINENPIQATVNSSLPNVNSTDELIVEVPFSYSMIYIADFVIITDRSISALPRRYVGRVTSVEYSSMTMSVIRYIIDPWHTACEWGNFNIRGLIERTHINVGINNWANSQPEPYPINDTKRQAGSDLTNSFNQAIASFENRTLGLDDGFCFVLKISNRLASWLGISAWTENPTTNNLGIVVDLGFTEDLTRPVISSTPFISSMWGAEITSGVPIVFTNRASLDNFVAGAVRTGAMLRYANIPPNTAWGLLRMAGRGLAMMFNGNEDIGHIIQTIMFDENDLGELYWLPREFARVSIAQSQNIRINMPTNITGGLGNPSTDKLYKYPYTYYQVETNVGGSMTIIPQTHYRRSSQVFANQNEIWFDLTFYGGNAPQVRMRMKQDVGTNGNLMSSVSDEEIIVREYLPIPYNIDVDANRQKVIERQFRKEQRKISARIAVGAVVGIATIATAIASKGLSKMLAPAKKSAIQQSPQITQFGGVSSALMGAGLATSAMTPATQDIQLVNAFSTVTNNSPTSLTISGGTNLASLEPPFSVYRLGGTDMEINSLSNIIEEYGETVNSYSSNATGGGQLFGNSVTISIRNRQYLKMPHSTITGTGTGVIIPKRLMSYIIEDLSNGVFIRRS